MSQPSWARAFVDVKEEHGFRPLRIEGTVPHELDGVLWSNGSATYSDVAPHERMWLDGDGAVSALRIRDGGVEAAVRRVETPALREERRRGRRVHGRYHVRAPFLQHVLELVGRRPRRNPANTSVWVHRGRVFALCPAGLPTELDPEDLSTRGETDFDGIVAGSFSAHASYSAARRAFYNFGFRFGRESFLDLYAFPDDGGAKRIAAVPLAGPLFNHDFMLTERWAVFVLAPARIDPMTMLLGRPLARALRWKPEEGTEIVLVGLDAPHEVVRFSIDPCVVIHFANAWEEGDELVLHAPVGHDFMRTWRWLESLAKGKPARAPDHRLSELRIDPKKKRASLMPLADVTSETPRICPRFEMRRQRFVYGTGFTSEEDVGPTDRILKTDVERGQVKVLSPGADTFVSEPVFVPRRPDAAEDDGFLVGLAFDARADESFLAIFDREEPVARAWLGQTLPPVFHGTWRGQGDQVGPRPSSSAP